MRRNKRDEDNDNGQAVKAREVNGEEEANEGISIVKARKCSSLSYVFAIELSMP